MAGSTHSPDYQLFLQILRDVRKRQGVPQVELAERLGSTQTFISKCERGERRIDVVEFIELAEALGAEPRDVLTEFLNRRRELHALDKPS